MKNVVVKTNFDFPRQAGKYIGKVRDVYTINGLLVMIVTDRISAFDVVLPEGIPHKGQILNQIASKFLDDTKDICPNWKICSPDPMVTIGWKCEPFRVEMVIRGYLTGSAWRDYQAAEKAGKPYSICGIPLESGLKEWYKFPVPIITPTTKAEQGHDENISKGDIIAQGLVSREEYEQLEKYTYELFQRGTEIAARQGLILVDTKYEFGKKDGKIYLIDEIHTPDSSRYVYADSINAEEPKQLSKEFVRKWLMERGFQGKSGQTVPEMTPEFCNSISKRYLELYEQITGEPFVKTDEADIVERIEKNINLFLHTVE
ncbi:MAG: phosphoribosylaminoimidazolesuccinocarboxamide synthase [Candidatus Peribacteria bacterium]|nr:phosphoribosylaminoimidazolesuccinocarboxamide synthase [Candidatus Peribacteria bacterium]